MLVPAVEVVFWSRGAVEAGGLALRQPGEALAFEPDGRYYRGVLASPAAGTMVLDVVSPRPLRMSIAGLPVPNETLPWRDFQRQLRAAVVVPVAAGELELLVEVGPRPAHPPQLDHENPSRNRARLIAELARRFPDRLQLRGHLVPVAASGAVSLRFTPSQFRRDRRLWQHVLVRAASSPRPPRHSEVEHHGAPDVRLATDLGEAIDATTDQDRHKGRSRWFVPVVLAAALPPTTRSPDAPDPRLEPSIEAAGELPLKLTVGEADVTVTAPLFEPLGRSAPRPEYLELSWPTSERLRAVAPLPLLPPELAALHDLYDAAWDMLLSLVQPVDPASGMANSYIATGASFGPKQFVWDTSFTAIAAAYGYRALDPAAGLDNLYTRQFDGGYIHREHDTRDGLPLAYEPDFSPNPPIMSLAEWQIYRISGDTTRLRAVYPALAGYHAWLRHNRRLPDGTYWTTGLASGLDNSPALGDGSPDLSAQMAHDAETLGRIAEVLGFSKDAAAYHAEFRALAEAINDRLWDPNQEIYASSLPGGGHNPNKVVTGFWPLWAGVVPPSRAEALARHLKDPASFWRHHPVPSLAADSPHYQPDGNYWLGSTWAPTNYATIKGFDRAGYRVLALETTLRHLACMHEVWRDTGKLWENYCAERSAPGNWAGTPYCWSALGPIALLLELVLGLDPDAPHRRLRWHVPAWETCGVRQFPLGDATITLRKQGGEGRIETDRPITLELILDDQIRLLDCQPGSTRAELSR